MKVLEDIGAIKSIKKSDLSDSSSVETLTALGQNLAKYVSPTSLHVSCTTSLTISTVPFLRLPVDARVGKMLIFGTFFSCTDAILTIAACLSASKSPFAASFDDGSQAKAAHAKFQHPHSDFMTLLNVWSAYKEAGKQGRKFCREMFLNFSALNEIQDARLHFLDLLCGLGFIDKQKLGDDPRKRTFDEKRLSSSVYCRNSIVEEVVHSVICAGLWPNVAWLKTNSAKNATVVHKSETLSVRSSVNSKVESRLAPSEWLTYFEKFGTERHVSVSTTAFVDPFCLMLFGSEISVLHSKRKVIVDGWIELSVAGKTGVIFREIRFLFDSLLTTAIEDSRSRKRKDVLADPSTSAVVADVVKLLRQG